MSQSDQEKSADAPPPESLIWHQIGDACSLGLARLNHGDIKPFIGDLFERSFRSAPPDSPVHYVCYCKEQSGISMVGYGHCTPCPNYYLGGGMCTDNRALRRLSVATRKAISQRGGIAQFLIETIFSMSADKSAVFSYVGHPVALEIDLRSGFQKTKHRHLIVHWTRGAPDNAATMINEVHALGPF